MRTPVVQLTITGVLPANIAARMKTAAPTEAGIMMPTYSPGSVSRIGFSTKIAVTRSR